MDEDAADRIAAWHYPAQYSFYDASTDPEDLAELLDRQGWVDEYFRVDRQERLSGFWQIKPACGEVREVGLGLAPELTGRGLGAAFVLAGIAFTATVTGCRKVTLSVAEFNRRAIRVYERVGFLAVGSSVRKTPQGNLSFLSMELLLPVQRD